jgi:hypothetical protein
MTNESLSFLPASARGYLARRRESRLQHQREELLGRAFCEGCRARYAGLRCKPPERYHVQIGLDLPGEWIAGWATVDRQLFREGLVAARQQQAPATDAARARGRQQTA